MLPFNTEFQTGQSRITQVRLSVLLRSGILLNMTEENVMLGGFIRDSSTTVDGEFTIGGAVTGKLTVVVDNSTDTFSGYDFRGAVITASLGGQLSDESYQLLPVGIYTVDEYTYDGCNITLTAYDNLHKFDLPCKDSQITFPKTIAQLIDEACTATRTAYPDSYVELANTSIPNGSFIVAKEPKQWSTMTWHDVIAYCAQIAGCFARILPNGKLFLAWYNTSFFNEVQLDGGTFGTQLTPYADGDIADGGDFTYTDTVVFDGGTFGNRSESHFLSQLFDLTVDTDDALITGVSVTLDAMDNIEATDDTPDYTKTLGTAEYLIRIEDNPLIETTANADDVCSYIYDIIVGMRFRPMHASVLENPAIEAGDVALIIDRNNNTYYSFMSHVTYTTGAATSVSCDAASSMQNLKSRYSEAQKTRALAERTFQAAISSADDAMAMIINALATTMGLYRYEHTDSDGGTYYVYGNKSTEVSSNIRWQFSAGAFMVSTDYGQTWNAAITADGTAVFQEIYAVKVNADNIKAGTLTGRAISGGTITGTNITAGGSAGGGLTVKNRIGTTIASITSSGSSFTNNTFSVSSDNFNISTTGSITATDGVIGGFVIDQGQALRYGKTNLYDYSHAGIYIDHTGAILIGDAYGNYTEIDKSSGFTVCSPNDLADIAVIDNNGHYANIGAEYSSFSGSIYANNMELDDQAIVHGDLLVYGYFNQKNRVIPTKSYGDRCLAAYETAEPLFGDVGEGVIGEDGRCYIDIDPVFVETVLDLSDIHYQVFLQSYSEHNVWVSERDPAFFIVNGTPGMSFAWEIKIPQAGAMGRRLPLMDDGTKEQNKNHGNLYDVEEPNIDFLLDVEVTEYEMYGGL